MIEKNQMNRPPMVTATLLRRLSMVMSSSYFSTGASPASAHSFLYRFGLFKRAVRVCFATGGSTASQRTLASRW